MHETIPDKAYFRIGEVSRILGVEPYVIRYWESVFRTVRPERTRSDQRRYRRKDVEELLIIKNLLYEERFTIAGAKTQLRRMKKGASQNRGESRAANDPERPVESVEPAESAGMNGQEDTRLAELKEGLTQIRDILD
ncbi:MAG: MerR family transcriptional regulator [Syntrophaceae bacterium]|nr:MerR family transcriptional regulator [Syntrophaceae bacterium]